MKKVFLLFFVSSFGFFYNSFAQTDTAQIVNTTKANDTLSFSLIQISLNKKKKDSINLNETPVFAYDFVHQYPFYSLKNKIWEKDNNFILKFHKIPAKGYIYVYSIDGKNNINIHPAISCDSFYRKDQFSYPDSSKSFQFVNSGKQRLAVWYSTDSIPLVDKVIKGIELTMGSFVKRNNGQIRNLLLLPSYAWHLTDKKFGFTIDHTNFSAPSKFILPVLIELDFENKDNPKRGSSRTKNP
jgi:hypothetical protein